MDEYLTAGGSRTKASDPDIRSRLTLQPVRCVTDSFGVRQAILLAVVQRLRRASGCSFTVVCS